jgi:hypothetical protein
MALKSVLGERCDRARLKAAWKHLRLEERIHQLVGLLASAEASC